MKLKLLTIGALFSCLGIGVAAATEKAVTEYQEGYTAPTITDVVAQSWAPVFIAENESVQEKGWTDIAVRSTAIAVPEVPLVKFREAVTVIAAKDYGVTPVFATTAGTGEYVLEKSGFLQEAAVEGTFGMSVSLAKTDFGCLIGFDTGDGGVNTVVLGTSGKQSADLRDDAMGATPVSDHALALKKTVALVAT